MINIQIASKRGQDDGTFRDSNYMNSVSRRSQSKSPSGIVTMVEDDELNQVSGDYFRTSIEVSQRDPGGEVNLHNDSLDQIISS